MPYSHLLYPDLRHFWARWLHDVMGSMAKWVYLHCRYLQGFVTWSKYSLLLYLAHLIDLGWLYRWTRSHWPTKGGSISLGFWDTTLALSMNLAHGIALALVVFWLGVVYIAGLEMQYTSTYVWSGRHNLPTFYQNSASIWLFVQKGGELGMRSRARTIELNWNSFHGRNSTLVFTAHKTKSWLYWIW